MGSNLQVEYTNRRVSKSVFATNEGICFFDVAGKPAHIVLTSTHPRTVNACDRCGENNGDNGLVIEIMSQDREAGWRMLNHAHVHPDTDVAKHVVKHSPEAVPFVATASKQMSDLELWIWKFFTQCSHIQQDGRWQRFVSKQTAKDPGLRAFDQMAWVAQRLPGQFSIFYSMYENALAGRKYLLYR